jgi:DNA-binding response OmpR family regulator
MALYWQLTQNEFTHVNVVATAAEALRVFQVRPANLVLVDLHLSDGNTFELCATLLQLRPSIKIVLVAENDEILPLAALRAGVSGSISRNFPSAKWPGVLTYVMQGGIAFSKITIAAFLDETEKIQSDTIRLLSRTSPQSDLIQQHSVLHVGPLYIDLAYRVVRLNGRRVRLTPQEFALLLCLAKKADRVVTTDELLNEAWDYDAGTGTPAQVRLYIARLRKKLDDDPHRPTLILTERGIGYRLHGNGFNNQAPHESSNGTEPPLAYFLNIPSLQASHHVPQEPPKLERFRKVLLTAHNYFSSLRHKLLRILHPHDSNGNAFSNLLHALNNRWLRSKD